MLIVAKQVKKKKLIVSRIADDSKINEAVEIAIAVIKGNRDIRKTYVYLKVDGDKPIPIRKLRQTLLRGIRVY